MWGLSILSLSEQSTATDKDCSQEWIYKELVEVEQEEVLPVFEGENKLLENPGTPGFIGSLDDATRQLEWTKNEEKLPNEGRPSKSYSVKVVNNVTITNADGAGKKNEEVRVGNYFRHRYEVLRWG